MLSQETVSSQHIVTYKQESTNIRIRRNRIACIIALIGTVSGISLDYIIYPDLIGELFTIRFITVILLFGIYYCHNREVGRRYISPLNLSWALVVNMSICAMIFHSEGATSPYYAGLNLVLLGAGVMVPWTLREMLFVCSTTIVLYLLSCLARGTLIDSYTNYGILFNNTFFIFLTAVISSTSSHLATQSRMRDFNLRQGLDARNRKLEDMDREKSQFFANISHELRTPLTLILSPIQDLLQKPELLSDRVSFLLRTARDNSLRLLKLVNDLLEVIKLEEGKQELKLRPIDLNGVLSGLTESMMHLADARNLRLEKRLSKESAMILADTYALERVFLNLLSNAIKFTDENGAVTISSSLDTQQVIVEISDTGIGIDSGELPHIFDRFRQVDGSSTRKHQGSGLGLALVKDLTEKMSGTISAKSEPGTGTTVTVSFPLVSNDHPQPDATPSRDMHRASDIFDKIHQAAEHRAALPVDSPFEQSESDMPSGSGPALMIVDDEPDMRQYLVSILESDYRISQVRDGKRALKLAAQQLPDLMLLDLMLPEIDGLEVCKQLKADARTRNIKIILLTARIDERAKITALENGADDFLTKPFSRAEVEKRLNNLLTTAQLERELRERNQELENALNDLRKTQSNLIQSEKLNALGKMAAGLLHEVNNPLNYVITALQMAKREPEVEQNEELKDNISDIDDGIARVRNIVSDLHAFAYPSEVDKQTPFSLAKAIDTAKRFTAAECAGITVSIDLDPEDTAMGSLGHIVQVLVNLLSNAANAANAVDDHRAAKIWIRTRRQGKRMHIFVRDNGIGMNEETRNRIFDPFFTTRDIGEGMGLGLSVSHTIVQNHGGTLVVESVANEGTELSFDLPCVNDFDSEGLESANLQPDDESSHPNSPNPLPNA